MSAVPWGFLLQDVFMDQMQPIGTSVPWMLTNGAPRWGNIQNPIGASQPWGCFQSEHSLSWG